MKPKTMMPQKNQLEYWIERYLQAKTDGDTKRMKMYSDLINKLGGKTPKL